MRDNNINNCGTPDGAEKLFRSSGTCYNVDHLQNILDKYIKEEKFYNAYALALDYYELACPFFDLLKKNADSDSLYAVFLVFCEENDKDRATTMATILVDEYKTTKKLESILMLNNHFIHTFREPTASTSSFLIVKEAINAAIQIIEEITDNLPSDETATLICENMVCLPMCIRDVDFMLSAIQRIAACYKSESEPKLIVISHFLPALEQEFDMLHEWFENLVGVGDLDVDGITGYIKVLEEYENMFFCEGAPELVEGTPYRLTTDTEKIEKHLQMIREEETLAAEFKNITDDELGILPQLRERYEKLISLCGVNLTLLM